MSSCICLSASVLQALEDARYDKIPAVRTAAAAALAAVEELPDPPEPPASIAGAQATTRTSATKVIKCYTGSSMAGSPLLKCGEPACAELDTQKGPGR